MERANVSDEVWDLVLTHAPMVTALILQKLLKEWLKKREEKPKGPEAP